MPARSICASAAWSCGPQSQRCDAEDVAGEALRVDADEHRLALAPAPLHERDVLVPVDVVLVRDGAELAVLGRDRRLGAAPHERVLHHPVADEVRDRDDAAGRARAESCSSSRHARHRAVVVHHLADDAGGRQPREPREVDRALGLAGADEHAAVAGAEREDVAGAREVLRARAVARRRCRIVCARSRALMPVVTPSFASIETVKAVPNEEVFAPSSTMSGRRSCADLLLGEREADEAAPVLRHEVDRRGRHLLGREAEVALVLAILVVGEDHHPAVRGSHSSARSTRSTACFA